MEIQIKILAALGGAWLVRFCAVKWQRESDAMMLLSTSV
jgi:hypothetical protein